jgi:hypothetical protein
VPGLAALPGTEIVHYIRSGGYWFEKKNPEFSGWDKFVFRFVPGARVWHRFRVWLQVSGGATHGRRRPRVRYIPAAC